MADPRTRKERERARQRKQREAADRMFRQSMGQLQDPPVADRKPAPSAPEPEPETPASSEDGEDTELGVRAFFSLEERAVEPRAGSPSGSEDEDSEVTFEPLIGTGNDDPSSDDVSWPVSEAGTSETDVTVDAAGEDPPMPAPEPEPADAGGPDPSDQPAPEPPPVEPTVRDGLNALDDFGVADALDDFGVADALVSEVTPGPATSAGDPPPELPPGWGSLGGAGWGEDTGSPEEAERGVSAVQLVGEPVLQDPFVPARGDVEVTLAPRATPEDEPIESVDDEEPGSSLSGDPDEVDDDDLSLSEDSADMMFIVLEDTRDFPDLQPDQLPSPPAPDRIPAAPEPQPEPAPGVSDAGDSVRDGMTQLRAGKRQEAIALFERALRSDPDDAMAQAYLALAQELMIRDHLPGAGLGTIPRLRVGRELLLTLDVTPEMGALLSLIDGMCDLEALDTLLTHLDRTTLYRLLADAVDQGWVEL